MMEENTFYFVSPEVSFEETSRGARLVATVMELATVSKNGRMYRIEEAKAIAKSLIGNDIYYGVDWAGRHCNPILRKKGECSKAEPVGFVESTKVLGNKIKAIIKITSEGLIQALKGGVKFLFSVGGNAISETVKKIAGKLVHVLKGARCNHLQILDAGTPVGFPSAKMEKLIEINETVMICEEESCRLPEGSKSKRKLRCINTEETWAIESSSVVTAIEFEE